MKRPNTALRCAVFVALAFVGAVPAGLSADTVAPTSIKRIAQEGTGDPMFSLDFPNAEIATILAEVADAAGINLVVSSSIHGRTSIKLRNVTWRQIYREVLTPIGYMFIETDGLVRVVSHFELTQSWTSDLLFPRADDPGEPRIAVSFTNAPASEVLNHIAKSRHLGLSIPCELNFNATVHLTGVPWRQAFRYVLNTHGYTFAEADFEDDAVTVRPGPKLPDVSPQPPATFAQAALLQFAERGHLLAAAVIMPLALLHIVFAVGVARCRLGRQTIFLPKPLWVLFVLGGGIVPLLAYWLMHHSLLVPSDLPKPRDP